jgi:hypothetical protein
MEERELWELLQTKRQELSKVQQEFQIYSVDRAHRQHKTYHLYYYINRKDINLNYKRHQSYVCLNSITEPTKRHDFDTKPGFCYLCGQELVSNGYSVWLELKKGKGGIFGTMGHQTLWSGNFKTRKTMDKWINKIAFLKSFTRLEPPKQGFTLIKNNRGTEQGISHELPSVFNQAFVEATK